MWNAVLESGGSVVGDDVQITIDLEISGQRLRIRNPEDLQQALAFAAATVDGTIDLHIDAA